MRKKILLFAGGLLLLTLCAPVAVLLFVDADSFRPAIETELQKQLRRPVTLGKVGLSFFPLGVRIDSTSIGERPDLPARKLPFIRMESLRVRTSLIALLRREVHVESLVLQRPEIELVRAASGEWNFSDLTRANSADGQSAVSLAELRVEDGTLAVTEGAKRSVYQHVQLEVKDFAPGKRTAVRASLQVPGSGADALALDGKLNPAEGRLTLKDVSLSGLAQLAGSGAVPLDGSLSGSLDVKSDSAAGRLELAKASFRGKPLNMPVGLEFSAAMSQDRVNLHKLLLTAGKMSASGGGSIEAAQSVVDLRAPLSDTSLGELLSLAGYEGSGLISLQFSVRGPLSGDLEVAGKGTLRDAEWKDASLKSPLKVRSASFTFDRNSVRVQNMDGGFAGSALKGSLSAKSIRSATPDLEFDIEADKLDLAEWQNATVSTPGAGTGTSGTTKLRGQGTIRAGHLIAQGIALDNVRADASLDGGVLRLDPVTADLFGGKQTGSITVDVRPKVPVMALRTKLENVDANKLLTATTSVKQMLHGLLLAGADARLSLAPSASDIARSLNGTVNLRLTKGQLAGTNLLNQLAALGRFTGYANAAQPFTNIVQLDGDLNVRDGIARTDNLRLQIEGATLAVNGLINLVDQGVNLKATAVLDKATSTRVGGTGIGGYLTTALANQQGELVLPAIVTGTLAQPKFAPDAVRMAELKARGVGRAVIDALSNPGGEKKDVVRGILDAFRKPKQP